jgi:hypothetical protein
LASSFLEYKNRGFWIYDSILEPICAVMYICSKATTANIEWKIEFENIMLKNASGNFNSHMHLDFDKWIQSSTDKGFIIEIFNSSRNYLIEKGI